VSSEGGECFDLVDLFPGHELVPGAVGEYDVLVWIEWVDGGQGRRRRGLGGRAGLELRSEV
jgi:hypothetical protein